MSNELAPERRNLPIHEVRLGNLKAAIWQNDTEAGVRHNVTFERSYRQGEEWHSTDSYGRDDLLLLGKVADLAHSWICEQRTARDRAEPQAVGNPTPNLDGKSLPKRPRATKAGE